MFLASNTSSSCTRVFLFCIIAENNCTFSAIDITGRNDLKNNDDDNDVKSKLLKHTDGAVNRGLSFSKNKVTWLRSHGQKWVKILPPYQGNIIYFS